MEWGIGVRVVWGRYQIIDRVSSAANTALLLSQAVNTYMRYGCGVEAAVVTAKIVNTENTNV